MPARFRRRAWPWLTRCRPTRASGAGRTRGCWAGSCCRPQSLDAVEDAAWSASPGEWHLSVIAGPDARAALARVNAFNARWAGRASDRVGGVCAGAAGRHRRPDASRRLTATEAFFETPIDADLQARLDAISAAGGAAKVRTGGTTPAAIPSPAALADFLFECAQRGLPFKATAGLHHAVRSCYPLTYERDSSTAVMHGFLNALAAAAMAKAGASRADLVEALVEPSATVLMETARLHDPDATRRFFRSFGSCSFREPADELARTATWCDVDPSTRRTIRRGAAGSRRANTATTDFPIQNLPLGVFRAAGGAGAPTIGVAIGDQILDLRKSAELGLLNGLPEALRAAATRFDVEPVDGARP